MAKTARKTVGVKGEAKARAAWDEVFHRHSDFCRVFADPKRLRIMWLLGERQECAVSEIAEHLGASMQNTSQHLRVMRDKGAVHQRRDGQTIYYSISNSKFLAGCRLIRAGMLEQFSMQQPDVPDPGAAPNSARNRKQSKKKER